MDDTFSLNRLTAADFTPALGGIFTISFDDGPFVELVLSDVRSVNGADYDRQPFALTFTGPPSPILPQHIYRLTHPSMAALEIFIVPLAADGAAATYEAIFS